ncbi:MAG: Gx transporter family protein [Ruminococcus sp.]|nr:Gx transporter family protein [Ruminococcus sp.]
MKKQNRIHKLTAMAMLTALALIIFFLEMRIPDLTPVPGIKLGLANIITVFAVYRFSAGETFMILITRILLGAFFAGNISALLYSIAGAVLCFGGMIAVKRIIPQKYIFMSSIVGALLHNTGQLAVAVLIMRTTAVIVYYPFLIVSACISGLFTGLCAQYVLKRVR